MHREGIEELVSQDDGRRVDRDILQRPVPSDLLGKGLGEGKASLNYWIGLQGKDGTRVRVRVEWRRAVVDTAPRVSLRVRRHCSPLGFAVRIPLSCRMQHAGMQALG